MNWIISDVHGCFNTLTSLLAKVRDFDSDAKFVFVGDYVDRGLLNKETIDLMIQLKSEGAICLRGNHDDVIDYIVNDHCESEPSEWVVGEPTLLKVFNWWFVNGLMPTIISYGVDLSLPLYQMAEQFKSNMPDEHKQFFNGLPLFWESETHFACHAFFRPNEELPRDFKFIKRDRNEETLWGRFPVSPVGGIALNVPVKWDRTGVFGHTPVKMYRSVVPVKQDRIRLIDTGSFMSQYLTAYCCERDDWILQATDSRDLTKP